MEYLMTTLTPTRKTRRSFWSIQQNITLLRTYYQRR